MLPKKPLIIAPTAVWYPGLTAYALTGCPQRVSNTEIHRANQRVASVATALRIAPRRGIFIKHRIPMGKFFGLIVLMIAAYAIDAYAFGYRYRDEAIQKGKRFGYDVKYKLRKIGI